MIEYEPHGYLLSTWEKDLENYLSSRGIPRANYSLGYHQGCPTVYYRGTLFCLFSDMYSVDKILDELR